MSTHAKAPLDVAIAFTQAWTRKGGLAEAATFVSEGVVFDGPIQQSIGSDAYLKSLEKLSADVIGVHILSAFGDDGHALLMYDLITEKHGTLTCAKLLTIHNGKIQRDKLTFDTKKLTG